MLDIDKVNLNELREAIKSLNSSDLTENKIKVIGKKKEDLLNLFAKAVESVPDEQANNLPTDVILFYNENVGSDDEGEDDEIEESTKEEEKEEEKEEKPDPEPDPEPEPEPKKEKEKPTPKEKKETPKKERVTKEKDEFGYVIGTGANKIDRAIIDSKKEGVTKAEMEEVSGRKVDSHLYALIKLKNIPIVKENGKYFYRP